MLINNNVSFGRAIKVTGDNNKKFASLLANYANNTTEKGSAYCNCDKSSALEDFTKKIFNDITSERTKAKVYEFSSGDCYIFSGKEAEKAHELSKDVKKECLFNEQNYVDDFAKSLNDIIIKHSENQLIKMIENGNSSLKNSIINVVAGSNPNIISSAIYKSESPYISEQLTINLN